MAEYGREDLQHFVCPASGIDWTSVASTQEAIDEFDQGRLMSYVYAAGTLSPNSPRGAVLFYEPITNHGDHMHVIFVDGQVVTLSAEDGQKLLAELQAGHNPPRPEMLK